jgi:hypothetical protein
LAFHTSLFMVFGWITFIDKAAPLLFYLLVFGKSIFN